jgi:hypothetical protein
MTPRVVRGGRQIGGFSARMGENGGRDEPERVGGQRSGVPDARLPWVALTLTVVLVLRLRTAERAVVASTMQPTHVSIWTRAR